MSQRQSKTPSACKLSTRATLVRMIRYRLRPRSLGAAIAMLVLVLPLGGQPRPYVGAMSGVSALSHDARVVLGPEAAATSSYRPENGFTSDVFVGLHWNDYLSVQADYLVSRNALTLSGVQVSTSSAGVATGNGAALYEREFQSRQNAVLGSALLYFRARSSWVRPFLSVGTGFVRLSADPRTPGISNGIKPPGPFGTTEPALHVSVGIDLKIRNGWGFRYSFAETTSANPISSQQAPPGLRRLANFRNLFGVVKYF